MGTIQPKIFRTRLRAKTKMETNNEASHKPMTVIKTTIIESTVMYFYVLMNHLFILLEPDPEPA